MHVTKSIFLLLKNTINISIIIAAVLMFYRNCGDGPWIFLAASLDSTPVELECDIAASGGY